MSLTTCTSLSSHSSGLCTVWDSTFQSEDTWAVRFILITVTVTNIFADWHLTLHWMTNTIKQRKDSVQYRRQHRNAHTCTVDLVWDSYKVTAQHSPEQHRCVMTHSLAGEVSFVHVSKGNTCSRCQGERCAGEGLQLEAVTKESVAASASTAKQQPWCLTSGREEIQTAQADTFSSHSQRAVRQHVELLYGSGTAYYQTGTFFLNYDATNHTVWLLWSLRWSLCNLMFR